MATKSSWTFNSGEDYGKYSVEPEAYREAAAADEFLATNRWTYLSDAINIRLDSPFSHKDSLELCDRCCNINLRATLSSLYDLEDGCVLCQILSKIPKEPTVQLLEARQYVRICATSESQDDSRGSKSIQPGLPGFLRSGSPCHFKLIKAWLRLCDEGRCSRGGGCCPKLNGTLMPTRVIDVGDGRTVRLISTDKIGQRSHYIVLSHCWGKLTEEEKAKWCTTRKNKKRRAQGFPVTELPQTFQDAIGVTRELGQQYIWIDSLCIIQGKGGDWGTEAKKMEVVFKNAYCTIAATSAEDSKKGFLNRPLEEEDSQYVTVPKSSHGKVYICTSIDDFDGDVMNGPLNKRAWVLQERALSRRTIHFTNRQTYWECGGGVRCETLTYMRNAELSFRSDPEFPDSIDKRSHQAKIELFQSLFMDYSNLGLTEKTDRPVAINSLVMALANALDTNVKYGIFECFLHRSLLWQRPQNAPPIPIPYAVSKAPPSWSWMAYHGQIQYLQDAKFGTIGWDNSVQILDGGQIVKGNYILKARVRQLQDCEIKPKGAIYDQEDNKVGHLYFDTQPGNVLPEVRCAIIGRETGVEDGKRKYYVLFVTECARRFLGIIGAQLKFKRVGMGSIQQRFILFDGQDDMAQIV